MHLYIKNMVCDRCIMVVKNELDKLNIETCKLALGEVEVNTDLTSEQMQKFSANIATLGFELIDNHTSSIIEKIKTLVIGKDRNDVEEKI